MKSNAFFLGKGGVGKTTLAAAFALTLAKAGKRVLVASLDPAHNLGDVLDIKLSNDPREVQKGMHALEVDLGRWVARYLEESRSEISATYSYNSTLNLDSFFDIMKYSPGTEEYAVLWAIDYIRCDLAGDYDIVVYDTPPTALSLRFLSMPTISNLWVSELTKLRERILTKRQSITRINPVSPVAESCVDKEDDRVYGKLRSIRQRLGALSRYFSEESYMAVVINPDELSVSEAIRIQDELTRIHIPISAFCLNKRGAFTSDRPLDSRLSGISVFDFDFRSEGLHSRSDIASLDSSRLVADFLQTERKGNT